MIPKIIHYCWFGRKPLPELAQRCIASWQKFLPDYEIKEWNEDNFDVNIIPYTAESYRMKKYAFVSDYARFWILYHYGGVYFDTDVEVIKPIDDIIARGAFMGCEHEYVPDKNKSTKLGVNPGLGLGVAPGLGLYAEILEKYKNRYFLREDGSMNLTTVVTYTSELLANHGLQYTGEVQKCADVWIYPKEYFCPIDYETNVMTITENTRTIHHYAASWLSDEDRFGYSLSSKIKLLPKSLRGYVAKVIAICKYRGFGEMMKNILYWINRKM